MVALPVGQHGSTVAPKDTPHTPHLHRLLPIDAVPALPEPAPHEAQDASRDSGADAEVAGEIVHGSARAEEERELSIGHNGEVVVALRLRGCGWVRGQDGPVHARGRRLQRAVIRTMARDEGHNRDSML